MRSGDPIAEAGEVQFVIIQRCCIRPQCLIYSIFSIVSCNLEPRARYCSKRRLAALKPENEDGVKTIIRARRLEMLTHPAWPLRKRSKRCNGHKCNCAACTCSDDDRPRC
jgi:hypothetical protein